MEIFKKIVVVTVAIMLQTSFAFAAFTKSDDEKIWDRYVDTRKSLEKDVHALVAKKWPNEKRLADEHLKLELARLDKKDAQFEYLVKKHPERIDRQKGLDDFANFDWSSKDDEHLIATDKSYAEKCREVTNLEKRYNNMDGRSDFESNLKDVKGTVEYRSIEDRFKDMVAKLDVTWKNFKRDVKN